MISKNCSPFTDSKIEINNTEVDNAKDIDVVMSMFNLIEHSDIYSKTFGSLWEFYRGKPALNNAGDIIVFPASNSNSISFKFKEKSNGLNRERWQKKILKQ